MYILNRYTQQLPELQHWFPDTEKENYYGRKGQVETTKIASNYKNSKPKSISHYWRHFRDLFHQQGFE